MGRCGALGMLISQIMIVTDLFSALAIGTGDRDFKELSTHTPNLALRIDQPYRPSLKEAIHQLDPSVFLVNMTGIFTLRLDCWAPYPIDLRFYGHLTNQETTVKTFRKEYGTAESPQSWFIINATMDTYEQITGNYTCVSVEDPLLFSSYYIFVSPTPPGVLLTRGQNIALRPQPGDNTVKFPCAVSHPNVHVQFYKGSEQMVQSNNLLFDPKHGFKMKLDNSVFGEYSCRTELSPNDRVNFTLRPPKNFQVEPQINPMRLHPNEQLNVSCEANDDFIMVYLPEELPVVTNKVVPVESRPHGYEHFRYKGTFLSGPLKPRDSGYISCNWKSSNLTFAQWKFSVMDQAMKKPGRLETGRLKTACPNISDVIAFECSNPIECRINSCLRKDSECHSNGHVCSKDKHCIQSGLLQCPSEAMPVLEIFFTGYPSTTQQNTTNRYVEWQHASYEELLLLEEVPVLGYWKESLNKIKFSCQGSNFVFSSGFKWTIHFQDGARLVITSLQDIIAGNQMNATVRNSWKGKRSNLESALILSLGKSAKKISFIECEAPVLFSWQWISRKIPVDIDMSRDFRTNFSQNYASSIHSLQLHYVYIVVTTCCMRFLKEFI